MHFSISSTILPQTDQCRCENKWVSSSTLDGLICSNLLSSFVAEDKTRPEVAFQPVLHWPHLLTKQTLLSIQHFSKKLNQGS